MFAYGVAIVGAIGGSLTYSFEEVEQVFAGLVFDLFGVEPHMRSHCV